MVQGTCRNYPLEKLSRIWLTFQIVMKEIIEKKGYNKFKTPHMNKYML
jgi:hypothetical protein